MIKKIKLVFQSYLNSGFGIAILILLFSANVLAQDKDPTNKKINNLTIFSESNMNYPLVKIARFYSENQNSIVSINFNISGDLIQAIEAGEPADIFVSSHPSWIEALKQKGLVDVYSLTNIATDKLVLISSKNNSKIDLSKINKMIDYKAVLKEVSDKKIPIIVDSEATSLGRYTSVILKEANISSQRIYRKVGEDKKSIADFVNQNDDYCAIILASSVRNYDNITVLRIIDNSQIYYQAMVIAGDNMGKARDFLKFIKSDQVKDIFTQSGFVVE